jgi:hypothetical protein
MIPAHCPLCLRTSAAGRGAPARPCAPPPLLWVTCRRVCSASALQIWRGQLRQVQQGSQQVSRRRELLASLACGPLPTHGGAHLPQRQLPCRNASDEKSSRRCLKCYDTYSPNSKGQCVQASRRGILLALHPRHDLVLWLPPARCPSPLPSCHRLNQVVLPSMQCKVPGPLGDFCVVVSAAAAGLPGAEWTDAPFLAPVLNCLSSCPPCSATATSPTSA